MSRRAEGERAADVERLRGYLREPRTMRQLTAWLGVDRRTVYRYVAELRADGAEIVRVGMGRPTKYRLAAP